MPLDHKKSAPIRVDASSKRLKIGPDVGSNEVPTVRWSDIHYNLVSDIFSHLFTLQQIKYQRVSSDWNIRLKAELARSTVLSLRRPDLKFWKAIMHPPLPSRVTRLSLRSGKVDLVTDGMRLLIIDFASTYLKSINDTFGLVGEDGDEVPESLEPLADVCRYHPQIGQVVLHRLLFGILHHSLPDFFESLGCQSMSSVSPTVVVTLWDFGLCTEMWTCCKFTQAEKTAIESWKMSWPKTTLHFATVDFEALDRERSLGYWPYPPDQLTWLSNCLDLPGLGWQPGGTVDPLLQFMANITEYPYNDTFLSFRRMCRSRYMMAFIARFLTTFRQHMNFPPPPHPLVWND